MTSPSVPAKPYPLLLLGAAGGALVGARPRRPAVGALATLAGLALVGVAASGPLGQALRRAGTRRHSAHLRFSFVVAQPVGAVFRFCSDFENFPRLVRSLRAVVDFGDGRSHWVASTPSGRIIEWDAVTTKFLPNKVVAWQSTPGAPLRTSCTIRVIPELDGGTCVKVAIDYSSPTERVKDAVAALASRRRTRELEEEIRRLGELLDTSTEIPAANG
jgi:uncharacterized membrane protein